MTWYPPSSMNMNSSSIPLAPPRRRRNAKEALHRQRILDAALGVFAKRGFHSATMQEVAGAAGFSVGKLYLHFPSKNHLYIALFDEYIARAATVVDHALSGRRRPRERIEVMVRDTVAFLERNLPVLRLFLTEAPTLVLQLETLFGSTFAAKYGQMFDRAQETFEEALATGDFRGKSAAELTMKFTGIFHAVLAAQASKPSLSPSSDLAGVILRLFYESPLPGARRRRRVKGSLANG